MVERRRWTEAEVRVLREKWGKVTAEALANELGRPKAQVYAKATDMALGKPLKPSHWRKTSAKSNELSSDESDELAELAELGNLAQPVESRPPRADAPKRRMIDPTTCERDYSDDEIQFMKGMDQYKRENRRPFPTWSEVLEVLRAIGYRKVAEPSQMPGLSKHLPPVVCNTTEPREMVVHNPAADASAPSVPTAVVEVGTPKLLPARDERGRMIFDLPPEIQMAIKLRAVKSDTTTGDVICEAMRRVFGKDINEARDAIAELAVNS